MLNPEPFINALEQIDHILSDDLMEDLSLREVNGELSGELLILHQKLSTIYKIAHSHNARSSCFSVHGDWRRLAVSPSDGGQR